MNDQQQPAADEQPIERGAAEEASGVPLTPTEDQARRTPPSEPDPAVAGGSDQPGDGPGH
jgi:hypothetical protein